MGLKLQWKVLASELPSDVRYLALILALYGSDGTKKDEVLGSGVFPSLDTLVEKSGLSRATVVRYRKRLVDEGVLVAEHTGGGRHRSARYHFSLKWLETGSPTEPVSETAMRLAPEPVSQEPARSGASALGEPARPGAKTGSLVSPDNQENQAQRTKTREETQVSLKAARKLLPSPARFVVTDAWDFEHNPLAQALNTAFGRREDE